MLVEWLVLSEGTSFGGGLGFLCVCVFGRVFMFLVVCLDLVGGPSCW